MDKAIIEDHYHMTTMEENMNLMKLAHLLSIISLNLKGPVCTFTFTSKFLIAFLNVHTRK